MSTSGESTAASPTAGADPLTTFTTPPGTPASSSASAILNTDSGSCGAGFTTTVLPMASAGATLPAGLAQGLLYEVMQVTTPTGCRTASAPKTPALPIGPASLICGASALLHRLQGALGVPPEPRDAHPDLHAARGGGGGAGLGAGEVGVRGEVALHEVGGPVEDRGPLLGTRTRPGPEGLPGGRGRPVHLLAAGLGRVPDHAPRWRDRARGSARRRARPTPRR